MLTQKHFFITIITLLSITNINAITNEQALQFVQNQNQTKFLSYLLNPRESDILNNLKADISHLLRMDSESKNVSDALYEIFSADLDLNDSFKGEKNYEELKELMEKDIQIIIEENNDSLTKGNFGIVLKGIENIYMKYIFSFANLLDKQNPKDDEKFHFELNLEIDFDTQLINFYNKLFSDQDFLKNQEEAQRINELVNGSLQEGIANLSKKIYEAEFLSIQYIKLRKENGLDFSQKIRALLFTITRNMETEDNLPILVNRITDLSQAYLKIMSHLDDNELKLNLFEYLGSEKLYLDELNLNENDPILLNFNQLVSNIVGQINIIDSDLTQKSISKLYVNLTFTTPNQVTPFFENVMKTYGDDMWANWESDKMANSLIMTEILVYTNLANMNLEMDNFVKNIGDLLLVNSKMLSTSYINTLLLMGNCLDDTVFNYTFYRTLVNYRLKNYQTFSKDEESKKFDQFLDSQATNANTQFQRWVLHMKIINITSLTSTAEEDYTVSVPSLSEETTDQIINNHENQCQSMDNLFISIAKIYDSKISDFSSAVKSLRNTEIRIGDVKKIFSVSTQTEIKDIKKNVGNQKMYNFGVGLETGGGNLKGQILNENLIRDGNRIGEDQGEGENLFEVISGGSLTRKEIDIIKDPKVLDNLRDNANQENTVVFNNEDGSIIKISYIQVVTNGSDCYKEISKIKRNLTNKRI